MSIFATKSIEQIKEEQLGEGGGGLKRVLGVWQLVMLGVGAIIGTGIFVLTGQAAAANAGPAIVISMVLAGVTSVLAAFCYAEFASTVPVAGQRSHVTVLALQSRDRTHGVLVTGRAQPLDPVAYMAALELARKEFSGLAIQWMQADIQVLPFADRTFETVVSCETIEHVPSPSRAVAELARVLRPGGHLVLTTPNYLGTMGAYRGYLRLRGRPFTEAGQPINQFTMLPRTVLWLKEAGLRVERIRGAGHYLPVPGRSPLRSTSPRPRRSPHPTCSPASSSP